MSLLENTDSILYSPGERALAMTEKRGVDQLWRDGTTIDRNEWLG